MNEFIRSLESLDLGVSTVLPKPAYLPPWLGGRPLSREGKVSLFDFIGIYLIFGYLLWPGSVLGLFSIKEVICLIFNQLRAHIVRATLVRVGR